MKKLMMFVFFCAVVLVGCSAKPNQSTTTAPISDMSSGFAKLNESLDYLNLQLDGTSAILECMKDKKACPAMCSTLAKQEQFWRDHHLKASLAPPVIDECKAKHQSPDS